MARRASRDASTCLGATQMPVCLVPVQDSFDSVTRQIGVASQVLRFRVRQQLSQSGCLSLLLAMSSRVNLFFPPLDHKPPPTDRDRLNPHLCLRRSRFPMPRYAKRPEVALCAIGLFLLLPTPSSPYCILKVSEHIRFGNRPPLIWIRTPDHKSQVCMYGQYFQ